MNEQYYDIERRTAIKEEARMFRRKFITYDQAEVIYSISHKKMKDIAEAAGAVYRLSDVYVLINKEVLDEYLERFRQPARNDVKI
ncbi:MAG: hypothetical protein K6B69_14685 [Lachnospiraceae bacterium]|nr:hypothetical protein [Lachnospiraceae bacterium]